MLTVTPEKPNSTTSLSKQPERLQFGSSPFTAFLSAMESRPLGELVFKDVTAFNAPKVALARTDKERWDTATLEFSNTGITLLSSLALPRTLRPVVSKLSGVGIEELKKEIPYAMQRQTAVATKMARMGTSFAFFMPFSAAFWAAPFFRNWLTLKRTKSADFESLIGLKDAQSSGKKRSLQEEMAFQKKKGWKVFGAGVALGAAALGGFGLAARGLASGKTAFWKSFAARLDGQWQKPWNFLFEKFDLKGKGAYQIAGGPATLLFWGAPAYLGWIHAARSNNERRERWLQSANAIFWFFFAPVLTGWLWHKPFLKIAGKPELWRQEFLDVIRQNTRANENFLDKFKSKATSLSYQDIESYFQGTPEQKKALLHLKNWKFAISGLGIPIASLALVQLFNFRLTEKKVQEQQRSLKTGPSLSATMATPQWTPSVTFQQASPPPFSSFSMTTVPQAPPGQVAHQPNPGLNQVQYPVA